MLKNYMSTFWVQDDESKDAILLADEPTYRSKHLAFQHVKLILRRPAYNGCKILIRKIYLNKDGSPEENCIEWDFTGENL